MLIIFNSVESYSEEWISFNKTKIDTISAIYIDDECLWLGTNIGIIKYIKKNGKTEEYTFNNLNSNININDIAVDHDGMAWIATTNGIMFIENNSLTSYDNSDYQQVIAVEIDKNNNKWFITDGIAIRYDGENWQEFSVSNGLPAGTLTSLIIDKEDAIWIGTRKKGIISFDGNVWSLHDMYYPHVIASTVDNENRVWFGDKQGRVYSYDGNEWSSIQVVSRLWFLYSFDVDMNGVIWACSNKGLYRVENEEITVYTKEDGLESTKCNIVKADNSDEHIIWTVGIRGLTLFDGNRFSTFYPLTGPASKTTKAIVIDHNNIKWFGHQSKSISRFDDLNWSELRYKNIEVIGENMAVDTNNKKWFSAEPGYVLTYDDNGFTDMKSMENIEKWVSVFMKRFVASMHIQ